MSDLCWCKVRWWGAQWQQQQQQEGRHHQASSAFSSVLGSSSTPAAAAAAAVRCILLGTTCTSANLAGWTEQGPEGGEGRVKGGGEGGVFGFPKKSTMYSSYSGRTRFLQGPYLGPSGLTGWPNCKLYKIKILNKAQTQTTYTTVLDTFGSLSAKWKEHKNHHCSWLSHQMEEKNVLFEIICGACREAFLSFWLVQMGRSLVNDWNIFGNYNKAKKDWYTDTGWFNSQDCVTVSQCSPYWYLLVTHI